MQSINFESYWYMYFSDLLITFHRFKQFTKGNFKATLILHPNEQKKHTWQVVRNQSDEIQYNMKQKTLELPWKFYGPLSHIISLQKATQWTCNRDIVSVKWKTAGEWKRSQKVAWQCADWASRWFIVSLSTGCLFTVSIEPKGHI